MNTEEDLNKLSKEELVKLNLEMQEQMVSTWERLMANNHKKFSKSSEQIHPDQLSLFDEAEATVELATEEELAEVEALSKEKNKKKSKTSVKATIDLSKLPEKVIHHNLKDKTCDICGETMSELKPTIVKELVYKPAKYTVIKHVVHNYVCQKCSLDSDSIVTKSADSGVVRILNKSVASSELLAQIIYNKYALHLPLYRQERDFNQNGFTISRQVISNWVIKTSEQYFKPIFDAMWEDARNLKYKHMDETTVVVIEDKKQEGRSKSYEWVLVSGRTEQKQMALYFYNNSREHGFVDYILGENATGFVMSDGYEAYRKGKFVNVGCLAHVRRMFYEACTVDSDFKKFEKAKTNAERLEILNNNPSLNTLVKALSYIGRLFDLDAQQENRAEMKIDANKVMDEFFACLDEVKTKFSSKGLANKAINYTLNAEEYIRNYLLDENLEISNNRAERAIKPFVIGRKNCLFSNTKRGAKDSSILYSIIESAKLNNLNALEYLNYCLKYLAKNGINDDNIHAVLPYSDKLPKELYLNKNPN